MQKMYMALGALVVGILIGLTEGLGLPGYLHYLWALLVFVWGAITWMQK